MKNAYNRILHNKFVGVMLALTVLSPLGACGDSTATNIPIQTTAAAVAGATTAAQIPGAGGTTVAPGNPGNLGQGRLNAPLSGTVDSYDATGKILSIKAADGTIQKFDVTNTRITKADKVAFTDLGKSITSTEIVQVAGEKAADGSYTATQLTLMDAAAFGNGGQGGNGFPGGRGQGGNPPVNGTPGAGNGGQGGNVPANGTPVAGGQPGAAGGQPGFGGQRGGLVLRNATLSGTTLTGTDFSGATVTVNLTSTTPITKRVEGAVTDLTSGVAVNVTYRASQTGGNSSAILITINE